MNDRFEDPTPFKPQEAVPASAQAATTPSMSTSERTDGKVEPRAHSAPPSIPVMSQPSATGMQQPGEQPSSNFAQPAVTQPVQPPTTQPEGSQVRSQSGTASGTQPAGQSVAQPSPRPNPASGVQVEQVAGNTSDSNSGPRSGAPIVAKPGMPGGHQPASQSGSHAGAQPDPQPTRHGNPTTGAHPSTATAAMRNSPAHPGSSNGPPPASASRTLIKNWSSLSPAQKQAYFQDTNSPRSRKKSRPSLDMHRDFILDCLEGKANLRRVFCDLCALDPALVTDFGEKGHRRFVAAVKDLPRND